MKKTILTFLAISASVLAQAQFEKGMKMANLAFNGWRYSTIDEQENSDAFNEGVYSRFNTSLNIGYFISDRFQAGIYGGYSHYNSVYSEWQSETEFFRESRLKENQLSTGLFGLYFYPINQKFSFYIRANAGYVAGKRNQLGYTPLTETNFEQTSKGFSAAVSPGMNYFIHPKVALTVQIGGIHFVHTTKTNYGAGLVTSKEKNNELIYNLNLASVSFGVSFFFK